VEATIASWSADPESPNATLASDHLWHAIPLRSLGEIPELPFFKPQFEHPYPIWAGPTTIEDLLQIINERRSHASNESIEAFRRRMKKQFDDQLASYIRTAIRADRESRAVSQIRVHAEWTALRFTGESFADVARTELNGAPHRDPESAVRMAVHRFANGIGLTLR
jgi:hypothetical protein